MIFITAHIQSKYNALFSLLSLFIEMLKIYGFFLFLD